MDNTNVVRIHNRALFSCSGKIKFTGKWMKVETTMIKKVTL